MTSISKLIVGGFKSIRERTEIPIAPLTFLVGPNSAGKSVILEATKALKKRITGRLNDGDNAWLGPESYGAQVHSLPLSKGLQSPNSVPVCLGINLEGFSATHGEVTFDHECSKAAMAFFGALHGSSVEVEVVEHPFWVDDSEFEHPGVKSFLRVDGVNLLEFLPTEYAEKKGLPPAVFLDAAEQLQSALDFEADLEQPQLGVVRINLKHPLWMMTSIAQSQADLQQFYLSEEFTSDKERQTFVTLLQRLRANIVMPDLDCLKQTISNEGDWLCIGSRVKDFFQAHEWSQSTLLPKVFVGQSWQTTEIEHLADKKFLDIVESVNVVLKFVGDFCRPVLMELLAELEVLTVSGDRGILKSDVVTYDFTADEISIKTLSHEYWNFNSLAGYAKWLAIKHAGDYILPHVRKSMDEMLFEHKGDYVMSRNARFADHEKIKLRHDFVNASLSKNLFGLRHYQVKPAVWKVTTTTLLDRFSGKDAGFLSEEDLEQISTFKVQLFLEDQNGRRLDFHEVGSGISYVIPILASLNAAKTSWVAQPELHLHPAAQCEMGDVFLQAFNRGHFSVVETHSEHLLLRVLKRIRQTTRGVQMDDDLKCAPEAVSVLYFDPQEDGSTKITQMRVSRLGDFKDRWPHGFFEERGRELFDE